MPHDAYSCTAGMQNNPNMRVTLHEEILRLSVPLHHVLWDQPFATLQKKPVEWSCLQSLGPLEIQG